MSEETPLATNYSRNTPVFLASGSGTSIACRTWVPNSGGYLDLGMACLHLCLETLQDKIDGFPYRVFLATKQIGDLHI